MRPDPTSQLPSDFIKFHYLSHFQKLLFALGQPNIVRFLQKLVSIFGQLLDQFIIYSAIFINKSLLSRNGSLAFFSDPINKMVDSRQLTGLMRFSTGRAVLIETDDRILATVLRDTQHDSFILE